MSTRVDLTKNFTINITGIILYCWYRLKCVKMYLKQEYFEQVAEFYFGKELHVSDRFTVHHLNTVFTAISITNTCYCEYSIKTPDDGQ